MSALEAVLLAGGGLVAGVVNTMAGGGSLLTVPLLVFAGVEGNAANGSNRVGLVASTATATAAFRASGVDTLRRSVPFLLPVLVGAVVGAVLVGQLTDDTFERLFGLVMIPILVLTLVPTRLEADVHRQWSAPKRVGVFLAVGLYAGAIQAGVGLVLIAALTRTGLDLVTTNAIKVVVIFTTTLASLPVFVLQGNVEWGPALVLAVGLASGGALGAKVAVRGGERVIRPVLTFAVLVMAGRMIGLY